uniref:CAZy families GH36 protein n=1 Tax=uncultured Streptococcus sp. TaxID=83427 RepID=A0A060CP84_9STRE|nr:CAZy families GH36 protein [uncultured Streptococcus sp.]
MLEHLYFGTRIHARPGLGGLVVREPRKVTPWWEMDGETIYPEMTMFEYPDDGHGDYRVPAYEIRQPDGSTITDFRYRGYDVYFRTNPGSEGIAL